jgi:hypothetical protein
VSTASWRGSKRKGRPPPWRGEVAETAAAWSAGRPPVLRQAWEVTVELPPATRRRGRETVGASTPRTKSGTATATGSDRLAGRSGRVSSGSTCGSWGSSRAASRRGSRLRAEQPRAGLTREPPVGFDGREVE